MSSSFTLGDGDGPRPTPHPSGEPPLVAPCLPLEQGRAGTDTPALSVRDVLRERIGNTLVERYVADILGINIDMPIDDLKRWIHNGPRWDRLLKDTFETIDRPAS